MFAMAIVMAATATGVDYGWQTNDHGELEYIIQLEPALVEALLAGELIRSEIPPVVEGVRSFRIQVGRDPLPREAAPSIPEDDPNDEPLLSSPRESPFRPVPPEIEAPPLLSEPSSEDETPSSRDPSPFPTPSRSLDPPDEESEAEPTPVPETGSSGLFGGFPSEYPQTFDPPEQAVHLEPIDETEPENEQPVDESQAKVPTPAEPSDTAESGRPWFPFILTAILLFASIGANIYLFGILRETLSRYRRLLSKTNKAIA